MTVTEDTLPLILQAPPAIERAVRDALRAALDARRYRDVPLDARSFVNATLLGLAASRAFGALDAVGRHELDALALRVAKRFATSKLAERLFTVALDHVAVGAVAGEFDVTVRDECGATHLVAIETHATANERLGAVRRIAASTRTSALADGANPVVHCFSLRDGRLRSYGRRATSAVPLRALKRRAA